MQEWREEAPSGRMSSSSLCKLSTHNSNSRGFRDRCTQEAGLSIRSFKTFNPKLILIRNQFYLHLSRNANQRTTTCSQITWKKRVHLSASVSAICVFLLFLRMVHLREYSNCSLLDLQRRWIRVVNHDQCYKRPFHHCSDEVPSTASFPSLHENEKDCIPSCKVK